jgi:hypothetical protein
VHTPSSEYHHGDASPAVSLTDSSILQVRCVQLLAMSARLVQAARGPSTAAPRVAAAVRQCEQALQLAEMIASGELEEQEEEEGGVV